jgi:8-oxo-dGTP pyrophosphatase MutT (NUDIX family)
MYKVFLNEKKLIITPPGNITLNKPSVNFALHCTRNELENWFEIFVSSHELEVLVTHPIPEKWFELFQSLFISVPAAGGIVRKKNTILFIFRNGKWDLPKGKIDRGESAQQAALREVEEECGISGHTIVKKLSSTFHIYKSPYKKTFGKWIFKETFWYEMNYTGEENGTPELNEGITRVEWFEKNKLATVLENTYENLKEIISIYRL